MKKSKKEKISDDKKLKTANSRLSIKNEQDEESANQPFSDSIKSLMPELEELVKKSPNRLIGCGG